MESPAASVIDKEHRAARCPVSVVIPTYGRDEVLLETVRQVLRQEPPAHEILIVDQTKHHDPGTDEWLRALVHGEQIRWFRLERPSIPRAMNLGLLKARQEYVLFLDDDIVPDSRLTRARAHARAHETQGVTLVAGWVVQPWDADALLMDGPGVGFSSKTRRRVEEFMGGNFSVKRSDALAVGGSDENFVHVACRFERGFADGLLSHGGQIVFEPEACIRHLKAEAGSTRTYGHHLRTMRPSHSVGEYYYLLRRAGRVGRLRRVARRPIEAVMTRYHLRRPWWILASLVAEVSGFLWAVCLAVRGPRYIGDRMYAGRGDGEV